MEKGLIDKMLLGFVCSVAAGVIAWLALVKFVTKLMIEE